MCFDIILWFSLLAGIFFKGELLAGFFFFLQFSFAGFFLGGGGELSPPLSGDF